MHGNGSYTHAIFTYVCVLVYAQEENLKLRKALLEAESTVDVAKEALAIAAEAAAAAVDEAAGVAEASHGHQPYRQLFMSHSTDLDVHA